MTSSHVPGARSFGDSTDCVCCNNPWSKQASNKFALMCGTCAPIEIETDRSLDPSNFDLSIPPSDDFFNYCNGGWQKKNPIPPEYPNWNTFLELHTINQERIKLLLGNLSSGNDDGRETPLEGEAKMVSIYYNAALDEEAVEKAGHVKPLAPLMAHCENAAAKKGRAGILGEFLSKFGLSYFLALGHHPIRKIVIIVLHNLVNLVLVYSIVIITLMKIKKINAKNIRNTSQTCCYCWIPCFIRMRLLPKFL
mmetsp:Transcript_27561/g.28083  ORF Transcript_27561/g.28083 Transcript_27561/m.28083 type:complete len:251 (+) Transcript_27561:111-863(+)